MTRLYSALLTVLCGCLVPGAAAAQVPMDYRIDVNATIIRADGGDQRSVVTSTGPINLNYTTRIAFVQPSDRCGHFSSHADGTVVVDDKTIGGWAGEVTPLRLEGKAMTFRLRWQRIRSAQSPLGEKQEQVMTLRLGEAATIDVVPFSKEAQVLRAGCDTIATALRVSVEPAMRSFKERRLLAIDVWLVERMLDGSEKSQTLMMKGVPHVAMPFYFTAGDEGTTKIDIFGEILPMVLKEGIELTINTDARLLEGFSVRTMRAQAPLRGPYAKSPVLVLKPEEIVSMELPAIDFKFADGKVARHFSLRLRARILRK